MEYIHFLIETKQQKKLFALDFISHLIHRGKQNVPNMEYTGWASFENLPDEIILKIFSFLKINDLYQCMSINKKMRNIASDKSLWKQIHLTGEIPVKLLENVLVKGCQYLSLYDCKIFGNNVWFQKNFQLKYLSITHNEEVYGSMYWSNFETLSKLTAFCYKIEKLSINYCSLGSIMKCIIQSRYTLKILNFRRNYINPESLKQIVTHCLELNELNISFLNGGNIHLNYINYLCNNMSTNIEKLDISGQMNFGDDQLKMLLKRCKNLTEFAFGNTSVSDESVDIIIKTLSKSLIKIDPSHQIGCDRLLEIESMPKLKILRLGWLRLSKEEKVKWKKAIPKLADFNEELEIALPYPSRGQQECKPTGFWEIKEKPPNLSLDSDTGTFQ